MCRGRRQPRSDEEVVEIAVVRLGIGKSSKLREGNYDSMFLCSSSLVTSHLLSLNHLSSSLGFLSFYSSYY